jgi:protein involved in polysaccharide export with SLBB domain
MKSSMKNPTLEHRRRSGSSLIGGSDRLQGKGKGAAASMCRALALAVVAILFGAGCQSAPTVPPDAMIPSRPVTLSAGDSLKLTFPGAPELNQSQKIRADGKLSLPQIGEIDAAGKSLPQLKSDLARLYRSQLRNSDILVTLESGVMQVYVSGAVHKPGKLSFDRPTTILQVIAEVGGPTDFGSLKKVRVIRLENGQQRVQTLDLRSAMKGGVTGAFYIRNGDIITVPQSAF